MIFSFNEYFIHNHFLLLYSRSSGSAQAEAANSSNIIPILPVFPTAAHDEFSNGDFRQEIIVFHQHKLHLSGFFLKSLLIYVLD